MKMPISRSNAFRRSILAVATARKGDPNATLNAYPVTRRPAWGIVTPRSPATSGNSPMMTNSVVPMPNEARARANKGSRLAEAGVLGAIGMIALQQDDRVRPDGLMKRHTSIYAVCFHKHYRQSRR